MLYLRCDHITKAITIIIETTIASIVGVATIIDAIVNVAIPNSTFDMA